ncbi:MAG: helix-turn-helix domain-containing protein [Oscillospiraceae bacterium]|jgi:transcriptional regulator with XRE-family HTH domain|nr:helix-turn-helix domain-containing protein [Oscillospiraceae bacterium]
MKSTAPETLLQQRIAANIAYYRKLSGMTQTELAERVNYSDKSISKWERAAGAPDIYVLCLLAELFGVTLNDLVSENAPIPEPDPGLVEKRRVVLCSQIVALVWFAATTIFAALTIFAPDVQYVWLSFVFAVPASAAVCVVLSALWWGQLVRFISVSALAWTVAACVYLLIQMMQFQFAFLMFTVCAVVQVIVLLWYVYGRLQHPRAHK